MNRLSLLSGPAAARGVESLEDHRGRLGALPPAGPPLIDQVERADLRGRGGGGFPVATKWRAVAARARGRAVVLVNGAEGEPLSQKDRVLMTMRPHLVLDGAVLAARTVGANRVVLYVGTEHQRAREALEAALRERAGSDRVGIAMVSAPPRYVAGEESAAVHCVNHGVALPTTVPPRPFERGVDGRPTLVQNVESLAHVALIARLGGDWFERLGINTSTGTALLTLSGAVGSGGVHEVAGGTPLLDVLGEGGVADPTGTAVLLGGYFGGWVDGASMHNLVVDPTAMRAAGHSLGCGVVRVLSPAECGVDATARIVAFLSDQSARQCGPCVFGLRAIADALARVSAGTGTPQDLHRVRVWSGELVGRGACRHPDGAANLVRSALRTFVEDFVEHTERRRCAVRAHPARAA
jgi:NADH:ubiquinone oxidoreductase subunit F (NADH-binding)